MKIHPNDDVLEEFLLSLGDPHLSLVRHLTWCANCRSRVAYLPRPLPLRPDTPPGREAVLVYETALAESRRSLSAWGAGLEKERDEAPGLYIELLEQPAEAHELLLRDSQRFQTWGLYELLVERSLEASLQDPSFGEQLGLLAIRLADHLDHKSYGSERIADLRARAWAFVGNACRLRFDFQASEEAFGRAYHELKKGTRDGLERAIFLDLKASLRRAERRFDESLRLLRRAVDLFLSHGERHRAGRSLVKLSTVFNYMGRSEECVPILKKAVELIDPERDPRLLLCTRHNLIFVLAELGRFTEAQRLYREARPLYRSFNEPWVQNRRRWVRGKINKGLGQLHQAETQLLAARDGFVAEGIPYDTALVSLELALLYAEQGRTEELKRLAAEMVPIFASRHIHREALAALAFFRQAVEAETAGRENGATSPLRRRPDVVGLRRVGANCLGRLYGTVSRWPGMVISGASRNEISLQIRNLHLRPCLRPCVETPQTICANLSKAHNVGASPQRQGRSRSL